MRLMPIPWAGRVWALLFLTVLYPSERYYRQRHRAHRRLTERAHQVLLRLHGGDVRLASEIGRGTTVTLRFSPVAAK